MPEERNEERSWRPEKDEPETDNPIDHLMRELRRRREVARTHRSITRDYPDGRR